MIKVEILADSLNVDNGCRLTTFSLVYPRFIHSEILTHRQFSRNSSSSRSVPLKKTLDNVLNNPAKPIYWGQNKSGMQAEKELEDSIISSAEYTWNEACINAVTSAKKLGEIGLHKQHANRIVEPYSHISTIISSTCWTNFYRLRCSKLAQPEFEFLSKLMLKTHAANSPAKLYHGQWHLPFSNKYTEGLSTEELLKVCTARCARISYLNHDTFVFSKESIEKDIKLHDDLLTNMHMSPFEHCAMAVKNNQKSRNFIGFTQYRAIIEKEIKEESIEKLASELL